MTPAPAVPTWVNEPVALVDRLTLKPDSLVELLVQVTVTVLELVAVATALLGAAGVPTAVGSKP